MNAIRAFIAVEIEDPYRQKIAEFITQLRKTNTHIKWVTENQMHLTLKFLGNIEEHKIQEISSVLESIAGNISSFTLSFSKIGAFPNINRPRVIWLGIDKGKDSLKLLNNKIETELKRLGFHLSAYLETGEEKREYKVHLTLGRVKSLKNISELTQVINKIDFQLQGEIEINKVALFQSTLTPKGAIYTPLTEHKLATS